RTRAANILYQRRLIDGQQALQPRAAKLPIPYEAQRIAPSCRSYCANVIRAILMSQSDLRACRRRRFHQREGDGDQQDVRYPLPCRVPNAPRQRRLRKSVIQHESIEWRTINGGVGPAAAVATGHLIDASASTARTACQASSSRNFLPAPISVPRP